MNIDDPRLHQEPPELPGYSLAEHQQPSLTRLTIYSVLAFPVWVVLFVIPPILAAKSSTVEFQFGIVELFILVIIAVVGVPVIHEAIHGMIALIVGAKPFFGLGGGVAYTSFLKEVTRNQYLVILLAPLIVMSTATILLSVVWPDLSFYFVAFGATNGAGAAGDLWMTAKVVRLDKTVRIHDLIDGYAVYRPAIS